LREEALPAAHMRQSSSRSSPSSLLYLPATHKVQVLEPAGAKEPASQVPQEEREVAPGSEEAVPATQSWQSAGEAAPSAGL
jgi:hypothetical protein